MSSRITTHGTVITENHFEAKEITGATMTKLYQKSAHVGAVRQMVAAEIELERIRRIKGSRKSRPSIIDSTEQCNIKENRGEILIKSYEEVSNGINMGSNIDGKKKNAADPSKSQKRDFFGRIIPVKEQSSSSPINKASSICNNNDSPRIWYRFNEGVTNAVRRSLKIKDLFP